MEKIELKNKIIADFEQNYRGKGDDSTLDDALASLKKCEGRHSATGSVIFALFYNRVTVDCEGRHFVGNGGGIGSIGGGALIGDIYTDDIKKLFDDTVSYQITCTPVYACVIFFDKHSHVLGHFQAGAVSVTGGVAGGSGKW